MRNIKLTLEYDGTDFYGFQTQPHHRTVQEELETALRKLFQKRIIAMGSGRTDSGVHAEAQVASFKVDSDLTLRKIQLGLNHYLLHDLSIIAIEEVKPEFHAQFSAKWKTYEYKIWNSQVRSPLFRRWACQFPYKLDFVAMKRAAKLFLGTHDFRAFESSGSRRKSAVRTIRKCSAQKRRDLITFTVESNGFLYKMVRSIVGTLLAVGRGKLKIADVKKIFSTQNRKLVGQIVPAHGLVLKEVLY
ncbi:MAG: tRNA pseudouridine(38-40) synthase TruA [Omnitrophica bacterium RIFCSPLOWO2_12_FULL_44_17]|uniref:tRNA pseudouridine synthase A n=1 Tax=Candidatus Danuiimicrobium aquiferis TaxID=1801832 RepID=A0A1G1KSL6_9BACT|nr:MAG: tRNA pseudouridine(38-40) synthase TruA [Omnitrophica bacterium RIFCSPHIGHO2_02_FULL_45_28]OGW89410.1 MAG: tRNA pseudouridine(38-40) synthase TruA [Omnitrophica bacterium RIFCSPHIGHO2_12_FULL_44_12]OGW95835.1 MAG: tRNA pseudouridine(38-40) synthase TruA [Omnitrophica bacterium RIFCSPLOWO2_12_FULL_44_17]OGX01936.1 MAG: tRNA pseudouridine(38-40) synthase TruA [Omnitrophica bacterium RIFCSPLOWO2_02_FULL_44_11]